MRFDGFAHLLEYRAGQTPEAPALVYGDGKRVCSFRELLDLVRARGAELAREPGWSLGLLCDGSFENVVNIFASVFAGKQTVLLSALAPEALLTEQMAATDVDCLWGADRELTEALTPALTAGPEAVEPGQVLFFTSGTTERARAAVLTEGSLCASAWNGASLLPLQPKDRLLCMLPLDHVFGFVCGLLWALQCGASVALGRGPRHYGEDCAHFHPTAVSAVTSLLSFLVKNRRLNPELRTVLVGAGNCPWELLKAVEHTGIRVSFGYGLTETSSGVALSLGKDHYAMTPCPEAKITLAPDGEILISAPSCMFQGYYRRPAETEAALRDGVLHTGDLGSWDEDGLLHITGRKKEVLVLPDGTKLFLPEYEKDLARVLETQELAVVLRQEAPTLVLPAGTGTKEEILEKLAPLMANLPRGQQLRDVAFLEGPLPRTASGKLRRWELQQKVGRS